MPTHKIYFVMARFAGFHYMVLSANILMIRQPAVYFLLSVVLLVAYRIFLDSISGLDAKVSAVSRVIVPSLYSFARLESMEHISGLEEE